MESTIRQLGKELATRQFAYREAVYHLVSMLRIGIYRLHSVEAADLPQTDPSSLERVAPAISWISEHYKQELYIDELADRCNMSPTVFREQFRKATLTSPMEYINRFRVHLAAGMLGNREARVVDIALAIGFESPSSLNRWFRLVKGISPKKYRESVSRVNHGALGVGPRGSRRIAGAGQAAARRLAAGRPGGA